MEDEICKKVEDFFAQPPTAQQRAWGIINDFYHMVLTEKGTTRGNKLLNPDDSILQLAYQAQLEGFEIEIKIKPI